MPAPYNPNTGGSTLAGGASRPAPKLKPVGNSVGALAPTQGMPVTTKMAPPGWTGRGGGSTAGFNVKPGPATPPVTTNPAGTVPAVPGNYSDLFNTILQTALKLYNTPNPAAKSLLNPSAILGPLAGAVIDPNQIGQDAGMAFNPVIGQLNQNVLQTKAQNAQNLQDIQDWYGQLANTQADASKSDATALANALAGSSDAAKGILNAIGGSSNPAAAGVINANDIASAGLRGMGLAQSNYDSNLASLIGLDKTQQLLNETNAGGQRVSALNQQLASTRGQQASAEAQAKDNALQTKFGQLSSIAGLKANLQGNVFNELQGLRSQKLSELGGLSNTILGTALAGPQIQSAEIGNQLGAANVAGTQLKNQGYKAQINSYIQSNGGKGVADIGSALPGIRKTVGDSFVAKGGDIVDASGGLKLAPPAIKSAIANELYGTQGWAKNSNSEAFINSLVRQILTPSRVKAWDKAHKTSYAAQGGY